MSDFLRTTGNCLITNFDTRIKNRKTSSNDVIFKSKNNALSLSNNYNFNQISILDTVGRIAALDGKKDLSFDDLVAAKKMFANNKMVPNLSNVKDVRIDAKRRVGTIQYTDGSIIRMNFSVKESKGNFLDFSLDLAKRESKGSYSIENKYHYLGKYQMGESALEDTGLYIINKNSEGLNNWDGKWTDKAKRLGVYSKEDFLNNPKAQEIANHNYKQKQWKQIKTYGLDKYIGKTVRGCYITASGLLAGAHLKGAKGLKRFLEGDPSFKTTDGFGTEIASYIKKFSGYDVSTIVGYNTEYFV